MRVAGNADNITTGSSPAAHSSDVEAGKERGEDIDQVPADEDLHSREALVLPFNPQKYERKKIWLTVSQVDDVTDTLRAVSHKHDEDLMESLKSCKKHYGTGLMTITNSVFVLFSVVEIESNLEQQGTDLFLKNNSRSLPWTVATGASVFRSLRILVGRKPGVLHSPFR